MDVEKPWRDAHKLLTALEQNWEKPRFRASRIEMLKTFLETRCQETPHLAALVRIVSPEMTRKQLWDLLIPVERQLARTKITDIEIFSTDQPALTDPAAKRMPLVVVADNFRSAINVGTLFRVSECFAIQEVILTGYSPDPDDGRAKAAALGTEAWVPYRRFQRTLDAVEALKAEGFTCVALETASHASPLETFDWPWPCALFLGSERFGLDPDVVAACDHCVKIPLFGRKNSLNVVTAYSIAVHHARLTFDKDA